jgi:hypothetical protein
VRGAFKQTLGRVVGDRLLEFDGQQDRLNGRIQVHGARLSHAIGNGPARTMMARRNSNSA